MLRLENARFPSYMPLVPIIIRSQRVLIASPMPKYNVDQTLSNKYLTLLLHRMHAL